VIRGRSALLSQLELVIDATVSLCLHRPSALHTNIYINIIVKLNTYYMPYNNIIIHINLYIYKVTLHKTCSLVHVSNVRFPDPTSHTYHDGVPANSNSHNKIYIYKYKPVTPDPHGPGNHLGSCGGLADIRPRHDGCSLNGLACRDTCSANRSTMADAKSLCFRTEFRKTSLLLGLATHTNLLSREVAHQNIYIYINSQ